MANLDGSITHEQWIAAAQAAEGYVLETTYVPTEYDRVGGRERGRK